MRGFTIVCACLVILPLVLAYPWSDGLLLDKREAKKAHDAAGNQFEYELTLPKKREGTIQGEASQNFPHQHEMSSEMQGAKRFIFSPFGFAAKRIPPDSKRVKLPDKDTHPEKANKLWEVEEDFDHIVKPDNKLNEPKEAKQKARNSGVWKIPEIELTNLDRNLRGPDIARHEPELELKKEPGQELEEPDHELDKTDKKLEREELKELEREELKELEQLQKPIVPDSSVDSVDDELRKTPGKELEEPDHELDKTDKGLDKEELKELEQLQNPIALDGSEDSVGDELRKTPGNELEEPDHELDMTDKELDNEELKELDTEELKELEQLHNPIALDGSEDSVDDDENDTTEDADNEMKPDRDLDSDDSDGPDLDHDLETVAQTDEPSQDEVFESDASNGDQDELDVFNNVQRRNHWCGKWGDFCRPGAKMKYAQCCPGMRCMCGHFWTQGKCQCKNKSTFGR